MYQPEKFRKIRQFVIKNGSRINDAQWRKVMDLWDGLAKSINVPEIDTSAADAAREARERREAGAGGSQMPIAAEKLRIRLSNGKLLMLRRAANKPLTPEAAKEKDIPVYTVEGRAELAKLEGIIAAHNQDQPKKEKQPMETSILERAKALARMGHTPQVAAAMAVREHKAKTNPVNQQPVPTQTGMHQRWGSAPRWWGNAELMVPDTPPAMSKPAQATQQQSAPVPWSASGTLFRGKIDLTGLTGFQRAALQFGIDISKEPASTFEGMNTTQLQAFAQKQQKQWLQDIKDKAFRRFHGLR